MEGYGQSNYSNYPPNGNNDFDYANRNQRRPSGGPSSGRGGMVYSSGGGREPPIRIYVTLKKQYEGDEDYK